jgi:hypothetical protein
VAAVLSEAPAAVAAAAARSAARARLAGDSTSSPAGGAHDYLINTGLEAYDPDDTWTVVEAEEG